MLKNQAERRRIFSMPHCVRVNRSMKSWMNKNGAPHRHSEFAHVCDSVSYVIYRFFGRPKVKGIKSEFGAIAKVHSAPRIRALLMPELSDTRGGRDDDFIPMRCSRRNRCLLS